jgi:predicted nucleotidyltransferase
MDASDLRAALGEVADLLSQRSLCARIYIVGGAAMALTYDAERATRDIDAVVEEGHGALMDAVVTVARRHGWPTTWLNEQAAAYVPAHPDLQARVVFDHPALRVLAASPERMLAMKARAARATDRGDIIRLAEMLAITTFAEVEAVVTSQFPDEPWSARGRLVVADLFP